MYTPGFLAERDGVEGTLVNVTLYNTYTDFMSCYLKMYFIIMVESGKKKERQELQE